MGGMLIVGAGQAGVQAAEALRAAGYAGTITLLGDETLGPYHRPPLSKAWLAGEVETPQLVLRAPEALARKQIELRTGVSVSGIDRAGRKLRLADGSELPYDGLVLATGARPRRLDVPGGNAAGVLALRSRGDAQAIAARLALCQAHGWPVVVVGGGFIGLEVAATARKKGLQVTVLEAAPRLLQRVLAPVLSDWYAMLHQMQGVQLAFGATVTAIEESASGAPLRVHLNDGKVLPAGVVVVGIGIEAEDRLAREAGLECERGVVVDDCSRTADPHVVAAGDCTVRRLPDGRLLRLESVQNAVEQGRSAAAALLAQPRPFTASPWFWSDQFGAKLQIAGLSTGADRWVVRGDMGASWSFSVFHFAGDRLLAVDSINAARDHLLARKLLDARRWPTPEQAADPAFDLSTLL